MYNPANYNKPNYGSNSNEGKASTTTPMTMITLRGFESGEIKKEDPRKHLFDA